MGVELSDISLTLTPNKDAQAARGGNFDLRAVSDPKVAIFSHDIPGIFAKYVDGLTVKNFTIKTEGQCDYYSNVVELEQCQDVTLEGMKGDAPGGSKFEKIKGHV
jgi:hypothetical protein